VSALAFVLTAASPVISADEPPHLRGNVSGDGSTPPLGYTTDPDTGQYIDFPTSFEIMPPMIGPLPIPKSGATHFDRAVDGRPNPTPYTFRSITRGKMLLSGYPQGTWRAEPYFRPTATAACPVGGCSPDLNVRFHAKWGNVRGLVLITDGTPPPWTYALTATPAGEVPAGGESEFGPRVSTFNLQSGDFSFAMPPFIPADVSWSPTCYYPYYYDCPAVPFDPANDWGLRVVGDGGSDGSQSKLYYSNGPGTLPWKITLSTRLKKERTVEVKSSEASFVFFTLTLEDVFDMVQEQRELRKGCPNAPRPVNLITGNAFLDHMDVRLPGLYRDLDFTRSYNSMGGPVARGGVGFVSGPFGKGWTHTFNVRVEKISDYIYRIWQADGAPAYFTDPDGDGLFGLVGVTHHLQTLRVTTEGYTRSYREGGTEEFDTLGRLKRVTDRLGRATVLGRDERGRLSTITSPEGRTLELEYDSYGPTIDRLVGPDGIIAGYTYDYDPREGDRLVRVRYADGTGYSYSYSDHGQLTTVADLQGVVLERHGYEEVPRVGESRPPKAAWSELSGGVERHTFSYEEGRTVVTNSKGGVSVFEYTAKPSGRVITRITGCSFCGDNQSGPQVLDYDDDGRLRSYTDADGNPTTYYYTGPDLTTVTNALGRTTEYAGHDQYGRPGSITEPGWGTTTLTWSPEGLRTVSLPGGGTTTYTYVDRRLRTIDTAAGSTYGFDIDPQGQLRSFTDSRGKATSFTYDRMGRVETTTLADGTTTRVRRDVRGRPLEIQRADGKRVRLTYDSSGRLWEQRDEAGRVWRYSYDAYARLQAVVDPIRGTTRLGFDRMSRVTSLTDAKGQRTSFEHDDFGRLTRMVDPMGGFEDYTYFPGGRLHTRRDRKGTLTTFSYDGIGRPTGRTYSDGTPAVTIVYDDDARTVTLANGTDTVVRRYETSGALASESSAANATTISYTYKGGILRETAALDGRVVTYGYLGDYLQSLESGGRAFGLEYDNVGRRTHLTYPNGLQAVSRYVPELPWLEGIRLEGGPAGFDVAYSHDDVGNRLSKTVGGLAETYHYDPLSRLTRVDRTAPLASTALYGYDAVGNRTSRQAGGGGRTSSYDPRNRLLTEDPGATLRVEGTTSEPAAVTVQGQPARMLPGNAFEADVPAAGAQATLTVAATDSSGNTRTNTYEVSAAAGTTSYAHDANGNMTARTEGGVAWGYEWNSENQLVRVTRNSADVARFSYDPLGRRITKTAGGLTTTYAYDGIDIARETRSDGTAYRYLHGPGFDEPLARIDQTGEAAYYHADGLGSIVAMTDAAGNVTSRRQYDAWGNLQQGADQPGYAFTGREWDPETGLYYYRARYYDPKMGRFISEDPIGFDTGPNFYSYVENNPVVYVDPFGEEAITATAGGLGLVAAGTAPAWVAPAAVAVGGAVAIGLAWDLGEDLADALYPESAVPLLPPVAMCAEHTKDARPSTEEKHEKGDRRRKKDRGGEKGDARRRPPNVRPKGWTGPWPPPPGTPWW
jgi:RHS repeat-associated protein